MNLPNIRRALADYHGPPLTFMEICGGSIFLIFPAAIFITR